MQNLDTVDQWDSALLVTAVKVLKVRLPVLGHCGHRKSPVASWLQEMAAAEYIADEMTTEALEVLENEARSLMNDTHATWSSLGTAAWWQAGL
eukprot:Skav220711  [mRNA]  locus=scaffold1850:23806:24189:- [translate_table: standard]